MQPYHKIISFCWALVFLIVLQTFAQPVPIFRFLLPAIFVYLFLLGIYNRYYLKNIDRYNFWLWLRSLALPLAGAGIFFVLPNAGLRGLFLIITVGLITFFQIVLGINAESIVLAETLFTAFGFFCALFGYYYAVPGFEPVYLIILFIVTALLTRAFYEFIPRLPQVKLVASIIMGLLCSELYWCLNFLQFHFSVLAFILLNIFYFFLILNYYHYYHVLNYKKIQFHFLLMLSCVAFALLLTPWKIIQ